MNTVRDTDTADAQTALLAQAAAGDPVAAAVLARDLGGRAFAQAYRMLGNRAEAEDVAQEGLLRLWRVADQWEADGAKPSSWLYRVVANLCIDRMRKGQAASLDGDDIAEPADPTPGVEANLQDKARHAALQEALRALPDRQRQAVVLRHIEGLANPEIAEILNISVEAVESLTSRGKRALAATLAGRKTELGFEDDET